MKRFLIFLIVMFTTINIYSHTENNQSKKINLHLNRVNNTNSFSVQRSYGNTGAGLLISGAAFMLVGLTTNTEVYGMTTNEKSFFDQPGRAAAIISGGLLLGTGIVISIGR